MNVWMIAMYRDSVELVYEVRRRLHSAGLNLNQAARATRRRYSSSAYSSSLTGKNAAYIIPHTFYSDLRRGESPHICQVVALSTLTNSEIVDWLRIFGYDLNIIPSLQQLFEIRPLECADARTIGQLLRKSREWLGLRLREAQARTRIVASTLCDLKYSISLGSLSDYEVSEKPPRQIAKIITLCVIYGIDFQRFLEIAGIRVQLHPVRHSVLDDALLETLVAGAHRANPIQNQGVSTPR